MQGSFTEKSHPALDIKLGGVTCTSMEIVMPICTNYLPVPESCFPAWLMLQKSPVWGKGVFLCLLVRGWLHPPILDIFWLFSKKVGPAGSTLASSGGIFYVRISFCKNIDIETANVSTQITT